MEKEADAIKWHLHVFSGHWSSVWVRIRDRSCQNAWSDLAGCFQYDVAR